MMSCDPFGSDSFLVCERADFTLATDIVRAIYMYIPRWHFRSLECPYVRKASKMSTRIYSVETYLETQIEEIYIYSYRSFT